MYASLKIGLRKQCMYRFVVVTNKYIIYDSFRIKCSTRFLSIDVIRRSVVPGGAESVMAPPGLTYI